MKTIGVMLGLIALVLAVMREKVVMIFSGI
jgi:hypothetical protein